MKYATYKALPEAGSWYDVPGTEEILKKCEDVKINIADAMNFHGYSLRPMRVGDKPSRENVWLAPIGRMRRYYVTKRLVSRRDNKIMQVMSEAFDALALHTGDLADGCAIQEVNILDDVYDFYAYEGYIVVQAVARIKVRS